VEGSTLWLCTYDFQTAELNRIYREEGKVPLPGCWTPDGKDILIAPMDLQSRKSTLLKISSDGKEKMQITGHHENLYRHLALSPDGTLIVYAAMVDRFLELFIMPADGGISLPLEIAYEGHKEGQCWSPDGSTLALGFSGNIWLMDLDLERARKELRLQEK
jgi:Tol biopolymer transport system component